MKQGLRFILCFLLVTASGFSYAQWTQKTNFGGVARELAVGFSIGTKGYIGTGGKNGFYYQDFWEWDKQQTLGHKKQTSAEWQEKPL